MSSIIQDTSNSNCRELLDVLEYQGLTDVVISPGSRNTPLIIGVHARASFRKHVITDERTAAFFALGLSVVSGKPTALICTSGTAIYNYAPAIAEAFYQHIPLIVISADRPQQWIDQNDSQTLHQFGALQKIVKKSFDISEETGNETICRGNAFQYEKDWNVNRIANEAFLASVTGIPGPVHVNVQLRQPLNGMTEYHQKNVRTILFIKNEGTLPYHKLSELSEYLCRRRVLIVAGQMRADDRLNRALNKFIKMPNVTLMCETISNLHIKGHYTMVDTLLRFNDVISDCRLRPDVVISIGGPLVSRMLKEYLRSCIGMEHWTLNDTPFHYDPFQHLSCHIDASPEKFFFGVASVTQHLMKSGLTIANCDYSRTWNDAREKCFKALANDLQNAPWSELSALKCVFDELPEEINLCLSNGTCVRYAQLLVDKPFHACYCNRGVSGIEGGNATALGIAKEYGGYTVLVTGDMSFAYNPDVLRLAGGTRLCIILMNNAGGGIFRFVKTTRDLPIREEYFCASPDLPVKQLCEAYGWKYLRASAAYELKDSMQYLKENNDKENILVEICVDEQKSADILTHFLAPHL
ncbi:MAG: 2-succinyl-5-enolpyruvyl-6-hydroxy-3-cyclohexene-1-carboxylic-acid synthase [Candidatus Amulumruptor caecigallinarius]|nr:2-succinyl-5-enolpyruvyl-6-hydroxy-3-cyclohexene-1-carboxylic-acid synthase [Candidatus Amulumruptor caecigallinarius]